MSQIEQAFCRSAPWRVFARRAVLPWVLAGAELRGDVLEIGAGSGAMAEGMLRHYPDVHLTVSDVDEAMVCAIRRRLSAWPSAQAVTADVRALPFDNASFDVVTSYLMLHHVVDWMPALDEAFRVLRPGGRLLGYDLVPTVLARWVHRVDRSPHRLISRDELAGSLSEAGFREVVVRVDRTGHTMHFRARR
jgi:SAM-dependent methyltransferase